MPTLTVLHTNDLHGKLTDRAAEIIAHERSSAEHCLLLDAGDAVSSGNIYYRPGGEPVLVRLRELGYDAMAMGNREFHFLDSGLRSKVSLAGFPVLCANIRSRKIEIGPAVRPSISLSIDSVRVTIFGLTVPMITRKMLVSMVSPFLFEDPIETALTIVPKLRRDADILIALTHIGLQKDRELAAAVRGIDLIVGGHSHAVLTDPEFVGNTAIVQAGWWGHYLGKTTIDLASVGEGPLDIRGSLIDLRAG